MDKKILLVWMILLTMLAGGLNAISIIGYNATTISHVTGLISRASILLTVPSLELFWGTMRIIIAFFMGAVLTGFITGERAFILKKRYGFIIIAIGALIIVPYFLPVEYSILLFAFLMGMQNGMIVSFRGIVVRMTHMSGNLTDLAVYIGYKIKGNKNEKLITGLIPLIALLSFFTGGVLGVYLYQKINNTIFFIMSGIYVGVGILYFICRLKCMDKNFNGIPDELE